MDKLAGSFRQTLQIVGPFVSLQAVQSPLSSTSLHRRTYLICARHLLLSQRLLNATRIPLTRCTPESEHLTYNSNEHLSLNT